MQSDPQRRARGTQKLSEILGQAPEQVERSLGDVAPQLATYVLETIYGEIYQSPVLDSRTRQIVTVAALATLGTAAPQLRTHIGGALRCGVTREELVEIMMQLVPYVGVAAAINGVAACREVFAATDQNSRQGRQVQLVRHRKYRGIQATSPAMTESGGIERM